MQPFDYNCPWRYHSRDVEPCAHCDDACEPRARCETCGELTHTASCSRRFGEKAFNDALQLFEPGEVEG